MLVAVLKTRPPHHDTIFEKRAIAFSKAVYLFHHVSELGNIEIVDCRDFAKILFILVVVPG